MPKTKKVLIVNRQPPHGTFAMKDGIDMALINSAFGQSLSVLFLEDGVYQLLKYQNPDAIGAKDHASTLAIFEIHDVDNVFVDDVALKERTLSDSDLSISAKRLSPTDISQLMEDQDIILNC
ncbi:MAG: sulfurtransferase complex subunit TusC [Pseudomonadales bacterium]|nr:sulfurtransferase complex subunit TusC [Pseudomonadales bacterium]